MQENLTAKTEADALRAENARLRELLKNLCDATDYRASRKGRYLLNDLKAARAALAKAPQS